jgi:hypothetical protein
MLDVTYAFGMALGGSVGKLNPDRTRQEPAAGAAEVSGEAADVLRNWQRYNNPNHLQDFWSRRAWRDRKIFSLPTSVLTIQEQIIVCANLFVLCHELGHVALNFGFVKAEGKVSEELRADLVGLEMYWQSTAPDPPRWDGKDWVVYWTVDPGKVMAGYGLSVRPLESLAQVGVKFLPQYGDARARLELGLAKWRDRCPSDQYFDELSTELVTNLQKMDEIDRAVTGANRPWIDNKWNRWESLVSLIGVSLSVVNDKTPKSVWLEVVQREVNRLNAVDAQHVVRMLCRYYVDPRPRPALIEDEKRRQMGSAIRKMVPDLPPTVQQLFELSQFN